MAVDRHLDPSEDPVEEQLVAEAVADPEFRVALDKELADADRGELEPGVPLDELCLRLGLPLHDPEP
jgi:hypothetical protein